MVINTYYRRQSIWGVYRVFGVHPETLARWLIESLDKMPDLEETLDSAREDDVLEFDELWSFVLKKTNKVWGWIVIFRRKQ